MAQAMAPQNGLLGGRWAGKEPRGIGGHAIVCASESPCHPTPTGTAATTTALANESPCTIYPMGAHEERAGARERGAFMAVCGGMVGSSVRSAGVLALEQVKLQCGHLHLPHRSREGTLTHTHSHTLSLLHTRRSHDKRESNGKRPPGADLNIVQGLPEVVQVGFQPSP
jgi:hypothetical protein